MARRRGAGWRTQIARVGQRLPVVAALDVFRWHALPRPTSLLGGVGLALFALGWSLKSLALRANAFDETLFETQRSLILRVYEAVQTLRLILAHWPETKTCEVPRILRGHTKIRTM